MFLCNNNDTNEVDNCAKELQPRTAPLITLNSYVLNAINQDHE